MWPWTMACHAAPVDAASVDRVQVSSTCHDRVCHAAPRLSHVQHPCTPQVDSVAASLAVRGWLRDGAKLAVLGVLGLGLEPLLIGAFIELAVIPIRCASEHHSTSENSL